MTRRKPSAVPDRNEGTDRPSALRGTARDRALRLLAVRWRSEAELRRRLRAAGFLADDIKDALRGLDQAGLLDDARFARAVVRDQSGRRKASDRAIMAMLRQKGVSVAIAEEVLAEGGSDANRAAALAESRAQRLSGLAPDAAYRRLYGLLVRRGYAPSVARDACRAALAGILASGDEPGAGISEP